MDLYILLLAFIIGFIFEFVIIQMLRYLKDKNEKGYLFSFLFGISAIIFCLCEIYISQKTYPELGILITKIQHTTMSIFPIIFIYFWFDFFKDNKLRILLVIFIIIAIIQITTLWLEFYNIYGNFILKKFNENTIFEIAQWGYEKTGIFGYLEPIWILVSIFLIGIYIWVNPSNYQLDRERTIFLIGSIIFLITSISDVMVLWNPFYNMYFLFNIGILSIILSLNQFIVIKHKNLAEDLRRSQEQLKISEEKYRQLFEKTIVCIVLLNSKGEILEANPATESALGLKKDELLGTKYLNNIKVYEKDFEKMFNCYHEYWMKGIFVPIEIRVYRKDGTLIWIWLQASTLRMGNNNYILIIGHDITQQKLVDGLKKEELEKLRRLDQLRKDLISRISHELKTPLMSIGGASELLNELYKDKLDEEAINFIKIIERGKDRLVELVNNLIDVSRIDFNKLSLKKEKINLSKVIRECSNELAPMIKERKLILEDNLPDKLIIHVDKNRIIQVINNLISNAIKNTPPNGKIIINLENKDNQVIFSIKDTGIGLTEEEQQLIFSRFGKIERNEPGLEFIDIQGSGLGLYISKQIIEMHGGKIWAESKGRYKGAKFYFSLPLDTNS